MSIFVLIPGAGGAGWYWHRVVPELRARGHEAIAVDLPGAEEEAGLPEYTGRVLAAIATATSGSGSATSGTAASGSGSASASASASGAGVVLVAQSMGGFTAPMVCARTSVELLVLLNAMVPLPGETPGQWWGNTDASAARRAAAQAGGYSAEFDAETYFLHDVPGEVVAAGADQQFAEAEIAFTQPCAIQRWPRVPTRVLAAAEDRFFPLDFQRRVARERLDLPCDEIAGGHLVALSRPRDLADRLTAYLT